MTKDWQEKLKDLAALVTAIVALGTAIKELREALRGAGTEVWENWPWYVVPAAVFLAILLWRRDRLVQWLNPRSTVSRRDAFHIGRKYLLGREADIERLLRTLAEWPLVFLVGESGAGKSSLLERGVLPRLKEAPGQFPLLINSWGPDWIEGPREALAQALEAALDEPLRKLLEIEGPIPPGDALAVVGRLRSKATRTPILLFDQVDDYQTRHRDKFLSGPERTLLSAEALIAANSFWREVADLLKSGGVRCLFTTRSDAKIGLESVRFQEPKVYPLDPLEKRAAADLLSEISENAVDHPEKSFDRLEERLLNDLAADGLVLPIQMQVAFSGLAEMRSLSVGEYERQGGLPGLEALHLESRISAAARSIGVSVAEVRAVLLSMVDRATRKTISQTTEKLLEVFPDGNPSRLTDLLEKLELEEVVRRRIDPGGEGSIWLLDHDYLSRGLLELDRRAQRWPLLLEEAACSYEGARGVDRWKKLLPPLVQFRLFYERLQGRLIYGAAAAYASLSTVRFLTWILVSVLAVSGWNFVNAQRKGERLFAEFGESSMTDGEFQALWELASEDRLVRRAFLEAAFAHSANARRFHVRGELALHAAIGFQQEDRDYALEKVFRKKCIPQNPEQSDLDQEIVKACALLIQEVAAPAEDLKRFFPAWVRVIDDTDSLFEVKVAIGSLLQRDEPYIVRLLSRQASTILRSGRGSYGFSAMDFRKRVNRESGLLLVRDDRRQLADLFLEDLEGGLVNDRNINVPLSDVMTEKERRYVLEKLLESSSLPTRPESVIQLSNVIGSSLSNQDAQSVLRSLITSGLSWHDLLSVLSYSSNLSASMDSREAKMMMLSSSCADDLYNEEQVLVLGQLAQKLSSSEALSVWVSCLEILRKSRDSDEQLKFLEFLRGRLSPADTVTAAALTEDAMQGAQDATISANFMGALKALGEISVETRCSSASSVLKKLKEMWYTGYLNPPDPEVDDARHRKEAALERWGREAEFGSLARNLSECAVMLPDSNVRDIVRLLWAVLEDSDLVEESFPLVERIGSRMTIAERNRIAEILLSHIYSYDRREALRYFAVLGADSPEIAEQGLQVWIDGNRTSQGPICDDVVAVIRDSKDPRVVDLLKWPTCSRKSRNMLIGKLDDLIKDETFGGEGIDGQYYADIWGKFVPWMKRQEINLEKPPELPGSLKMN